MSGLAFDHPWLLLLVLLAVAPALALGFTRLRRPSLLAVPKDAASVALDVTLRGLGVAAVIAAVLGVAGLHRAHQQIAHIGTGAHIVLLLDRSLSMDQTFANREPDAAAESKTVAMARLVKAFFERRVHDRFAVVDFSTAPLLAMPLTDHREAVSAALDAVRRPALAHTDIGRGLGLALAQFQDSAPEAPKVVLFISDGAGIIDRTVQEVIRADALRYDVHLYYLYLRTEGDPSLWEPAGADIGAPAALNHYFEGLGVTYRAFEADSPSAIADATTEIDRLETRPLRYVETTPREDYDAALYGVAAACLALLVLARLAERGLVREAPMLGARHA